MWLLNHTTLRQFELPQLISAGVDEIYTPKEFPWDEGNLSATVTFEYDKYLTIAPADLEVLNSQNWYGEPNKLAWDIVNKYFDIIFIGFFPDQIRSASKNFLGSIVLRGFGLGGEETYSKLIQNLNNSILYDAINKVKNRFWFGMGYEHLANSEGQLVSSRSIYMPVGLKSIEISNDWQGTDNRILFVCPRIGSSQYFFNVYKKFINNFKEFSYCIGGAQPIEVDDPNVLGFLSNERYAELMRDIRVMFYHSEEANHIHYHPFEAVRAGIPLVFMANGMLDRLGGKDLPGRAVSVEDAKRKIAKILSGDKNYINKVKKTQEILLACMDPKLCQIPWRKSFQKIVDGLNRYKLEILSRSDIKTKKRIGVIIPLRYGGGTLRGSKLLAKALQLGAQQSGMSTEIVLFHQDDPKIYSSAEFEDLPSTIKTRVFKWRTLSAEQALRAMRYAGHKHWKPAASEYLVVDDGIKQLVDCDLWLVMSDRISAPMLPLRPVIHMVYDYLQRYVRLFPNHEDENYINAARSAAQVWTTTEFTRQDVLQYAGVDPKLVLKMPMLTTKFVAKGETSTRVKAPYFIWTTNAAPHKNHDNAFRALQLYYDELDGQLDCHVTGVDTLNLLKNPPENLMQIISTVQKNVKLKRHLLWKGNLVDADYQRLLQGAAFLWHAARIDNGTFSVVEAAYLEVPALSSDYPAMREMDLQFGLNLAWMDANNPQQMAQSLKEMEEKHLARRAMLPTSEDLENQSLEKLAAAYWKAVNSCL